jgi:DNA-binding CsgD family transcriptional regulator
MAQHFPGTPEMLAPPAVTAWVAREALRRRAGAEPQGLTVGRGAQRLTFALHAMDGEAAGGGGSPAVSAAPTAGAASAVPASAEWLVVLREDSEAALLDGLLRHFPLTAREAEVLYWVIQGKTNRDIAQILSMSPRTVHKHLEHVFEKLGVETRTAAAALALQRVGPV